MADNYYYVTAGLPIAKGSGQSPGAGENTCYVTAGLLKEKEAEATTSRKIHLIGAGILGN